MRFGIGPVLMALVVLALVVGARAGPAPPVPLAAAVQDPTSCSAPVALVNGSFEQPVIPTATIQYLPEADLPGWRTTASDHIIELWSSGFRDSLFGPQVAGDGAQFVELNANEVATLYQDVATTPGQTIFWRLRHRGRRGVDIMSLQIGPPSGPLTTMQQISDDRLVWGTSTGTYTVPANQTTTRFAFASIAAAGGDPTVGNFLDDIFLGTPPCATVTKTASPIGTVSAGTVLTYRVTVTNDGGDVAAETVLADPIPAGTTYVAGSVRIVDGPNAGPKTDAAGDDQAEFTTTGDTPAIVVRLGTDATATAGGRLANTMSLPGGTTVEFQVTVDADGMATTVANAARVTYQNLLANPPQSLSSTSNEVVTSVQPRSADLSVAKTSSPNPYVPGETLTYTVTVTNNGPSDVAGATVSDPLPAPFQSFTWTCTATTNSGCGAASGTGSINTTVNLLAGGSATFTISGTAPSGTTGAIANTATVTPPGGATDPMPGNNSATNTNPTGGAQADLQITKTDNLTTGEPGQQIIYTIVASNNGTNAMTGATVADMFPASLTGVTWTCTASTGSACGAASGSGNLNTTVDLAAGGTATFTVVATIAASASGTLANTASVSPPPGFADPNPSNNSATDSTTVAGPSPSPSPLPMTVAVLVWQVVLPIVSEAQVMQYVVPVTNATVEALVNDHPCGQGVTGGDGRVQFTVLADPPTSGCGRDGAVVRFRVNGEAASGTVVFASGGQREVTLLLPAMLLPPYPPARR